MANSRKAFHFDLDEQKLKALYPSSSPTGYKGAWSKIQAFMEANGFEHTQYSGYESVHGMPYYDAYSVLENLQAKFPWFKDCAKAATLTEIGKRHDVLEHFAKEKTVEAPDVPREETVSLRSEAESMRKASHALQNSDATLEPPTKAERDNIK